METPSNKSAMILTSEHELVKQYLSLDVHGRPEFLYTASSYARTGDPCLVSQMIYVDASSSLLLGKKEGFSIWDSSWVPDSTFVTPNTVQTKTHLIITNENECTKQYQEIDGQNRPFRLFEAPVFAKQGSPCKVTEYIYQDATSTIIKGKKEGYSTWDISWVPDSAFTVST